MYLRADWKLNVAPMLIYPYLAAFSLILTLLLFILFETLFLCLGSCFGNGSNLLLIAGEFSRRTSSHLFLLGSQLANLCGLVYTAAAAVLSVIFNLA
jgi:hypothetical protein